MEKSRWDSTNLKAKAFASGTLYKDQGNNGAILSQALDGLAEGPKNGAIGIDELLSL